MDTVRFSSGHKVMQEVQSWILTCGLWAHLLNRITLKDFFSGIFVDIVTGVYLNVY